MNFNPSFWSNTTLFYYKINWSATVFEFSIMWSDTSGAVFGEIDVSVSCHSCDVESVANLPGLSYRSYTNQDGEGFYIHWVHDKIMHRRRTDKSIGRIRCASQSTIWHPPNRTLTCIYADPNSTELFMVPWGESRFISNWYNPTSHRAP